MGKGPDSGPAASESLSSDGSSETLIACSMLEPIVADVANSGPLPLGLGGFLELCKSENSSTAECSTARLLEL